MRCLYRIEWSDGPRYVLDDGQGRYRLVEGDPFDERAGWSAGEEIALESRSLLPPILPGKIVGVGRNYRDHAAERGKPVPTEPLIFLKPPSAVIGPGASIHLPPGVGRVDYEAELGVVIGRRATSVAAGSALDHVLGLTCVNDVTARALQDRGVQFSHAKGYDTFAPVGPCIALDREWRGRTVECLLNGELRQHSTTDALIFPIEHLIAYISAVMTLFPGDLIATGTPAGIGPLSPGDTVSVRVSGVGTLSNPVVALGG
jgi:2-keto-4-pentenoate hydratase/2-oxohepta-3-ene-1,7-dioic acid hydratase in catechol pathway